MVDLVPQRCPKTITHCQRGYLDRYEELDNKFGTWVYLEVWIYIKNKKLSKSVTERRTGIAKWRRAEKTEIFGKTCCKLTKEIQGKIIENQ